MGITRFFFLFRYLKLAFYPKAYRKGEGEEKGGGGGRETVPLLFSAMHTKLRTDKQILLVSHNHRSADTDNYALQR